MLDNYMSELDSDVDILDVVMVVDSRGLLIRGASHFKMSQQ